MPYNLTKALLSALAVSIAGSSLMMLLWVGDLYLSIPTDRELDEVLGGKSFDLACEMFDRNGRKIGEISGERRYFKPLDQIPQHVQQAFLAAEDNGFYDHAGYSISAMVRAAKVNLQGGRLSQGASTITQQVARSYFLTREKSFTRKIKEIFIAHRIEEKFSKDQILELYLNKIFLGNHSYGVEAASRNYFRKGVEQLSISEAALLAGLPKAPSRLAPHKNFDDAINRRNVILKQMLNGEYLSSAQFRSAKKAKIKVAPFRERFVEVAPWVIQEARKELARMFEIQGLPRTGLKVFTTIDLDMQTAMNDSVRRNVRGLRAHRSDQQEDLQGAGVALDPRSGEILAMTGGMKFSESQFNRVTKMQRRIGSLFAPLYLAKAIELGFTLSDPIDTQLMARKRNMKKLPSVLDVFLSGDVMAATRVYTSIGHGTVRDLSTKLGLDLNRDDLYVALGYGEASPLQVASAYSVFANDGRRVSTSLIRQITDEKGKVIYARPKEAHTVQVLTDGAAYVSRFGLGVSATDGVGFVMNLENGMFGTVGYTDDLQNSWAVAISDRAVLVGWLGSERGFHRLAVNETRTSMHAGILVRDALTNMDSPWKVAKPMVTPSVSYARPHRHASYSLPYVTGTEPTNTW